MRFKTLLAAAFVGTLGALLPAGPASACITVYVPVIGSVCKPCTGIQQTWGDVDGTAYDALPDTVPCPLP